MKKTFRFLTLGLMLLGGTLSTFADVARPALGPANNTKVGATVSGGVVVYQVTDWDGNYRNAANQEVGAYKVQITGLDYTGLQTNPTELKIETAFQEKYGEVLCNYYVEKIIDTDNTAKKAFYAQTNLTKLEFTISDTQFSAERFKFSVGDYAFYGCTNLAEIILPSNVSAIGSYAYQNTAVTSVTIPKKCGTIEPYAFYNSKSLNTVTVESGNTDLVKLDHHVFANSTVSTLDLSNASNLTTIGDALKGSPFLYNLSEVNNQLKNVTLPARVNQIYTSFAQCTALEQINNLQNTAITAFQDFAFENCSSLATLNLPKGAAATVLLTGTPFKGCKKLANLTFAAGFLGTIGDGVNNLYGVAASPTLEADLAALKKITFNGAMYGVIAANAFGDALNGEICTSLEEVEFMGALSSTTSGAGQSAVINAAFQNVESLTKLTFSGTHSIQNAWNAVEANPAIAINDNAFSGTKIAAVDFKQIQVSKGGATIGAAFNADNELASVTFGNIVLGNNDVPTTVANEASDGTLTINDNAFVSTKLTTAAFGTITANNSANSTFTFGQGVNPVFNTVNASGDYSLKTVTFENIAGRGVNTIAAHAFESDALETVTFKNLAGTGATYNINANAFSGAEVNAKTVTIGNISQTVVIADNAFDGTKLTTVSIGNISANVTINDHAFYGDELATVGIGNITAGTTTIGNTGTLVTAPFGGDLAEKSITIGNISGATVDIKGFAFAGDFVKTVKIGNIGTSATVASATVTIGASAFANTTVAVDDATIATETIEIAKGGYVNAAALTINSNAFQAPSKGGEAYNVTIGNLICAPTIQTDAFGFANTVGTTSYTLGNVTGNVGNIAATAFRGSNDGAGAPVNTTSVTIGNLDNAFIADAFDNVYDVTTGIWNIVGDLNAFAGVVEATVGEIPTTKSITGTTASAQDLASLTFTANVADANAIIGFASTKVRKIQFTADDPEVHAGAFAAGSFQAAAAQAEADEENVIVVYKVKTAAKANQIFNQAAFNAAATATRNVILYTDEWSKDNVFQHYMDNTGDIFRLSLSASSVVPGQTIAANCLTGANGKYAYGRLYIPAGKGMKYYVDAKVEGRVNKVNLFSASIDGANIYMKQVDVVEGKYWIDATEIDQVFVVRTAEIGEEAGVAVTVTAVPATDEIIAENEIVAADWFDKSLGQKNVLKYATSKVKNQELQNNAEFKNHGIYVMANPTTRNLAFALLNQYETTRDLNEGSLYVLSKKANVYDHAPELNVIWEDDVENGDVTGINAVDANENNDAIYNLQGVRVSKAQKGLYIQNGKKFIVK